MPRDGVLDASIILSFGEVAELGLLWSGARYQWHITPIVRSEVTRQSIRDALERALVTGSVRLATVDTSAAREIQALAEWTKVVDAGEAEAIAVGITRGWVIGIEDRQAQRQLDHRAGRGTWINCANVLIDSVRDGQRTLASADAVFSRLDCYEGYRKRGITTLARLL